MFLSFLHRYGDIHVHIFPKFFFDILKFIFRIKGAYVHEIKSAFPARTLLVYGYLWALLKFGQLAHGFLFLSDT
jgi:hypothetical protein